MAATRGAPTDAVKLAMVESVIVLIPASSTARCTSPTDRQQIVQTGASTTASTPSATMCSIIGGRWVSSSSVGSSMYPMNE